MYALHQMVRRYMPELIAIHKQGLAWFEVMKRDHPDKLVFQIDYEDIAKRTERQSVKPSSREHFGPYDVIDRLGPVGPDVRISPRAHSSAPDVGEAETIPLGDKRGFLDGGKGSGNPVARKVRTTEAAQAARAERSSGARGKARLGKMFQ